MAVVDKEIETTLRGLKSRHLNAIFSDSSESARKAILEMIPENAVIGIGDSTTVDQIGVKEELKKRGTRVLDAFDRKTVQTSPEERRRLIEQASHCDVFLAGTNAVTQDGRLVNADASGNRVSGMFFGHPTSIIVVGKNKIVANLDEAFYRLRNIIAPNHLKIRAADLGGQKRETPCYSTGKCSDCRTIDRICNIFTIIEGKPLRTNINVILVNEDLGLSWDESWSPERITRIIENYKEYVWIPPRT